MRALIYKDLVALKKTMILTFMVLAVVCFINIRQGAILALPLVFVLLPVILLGILFGSDTQSKVDSYLIPSPVKRSTIVLSRYTFVWLVALTGIIFTILLKIIANDTALTEIPYQVIIATMPLLTTLIAAIQLPLMYKFGVEQGRLIFVALYFIIFALFSYIGERKEFILEFMKRLENLNVNTLSLAIIGFTILINALSLAISTTIYARKEF